MIAVTFARVAAFNSFVSMAEGMWENKRDDRNGYLPSSETECQLWDAFLNALGEAQGTTVALDDKFGALVKDVVDNCADNSHAMGIDEPSDLEENPADAELACCPWEVTISGESAERTPTHLRLDGPEMECREALEEALQALQEKCEQTDTASPEGHRARLALDVIRMMLEQRGLEVFKNGDDGSLPDFCNVVIFG